jgi:hypothetical protein
MNVTTRLLLSKKRPHRIPHSAVGVGRTLVTLPFAFGERNTIDARLDQIFASMSAFFR